MAESSDSAPAPQVRVHGAIPILFVRNVVAAAHYYRDRCGFTIDFLHGDPPFYGAVSRGDACLHLRHVHTPNFAELAASEPSLILTSIEVSGVRQLFQELDASGVDIAEPLVRQSWGGTDFKVRDPDGNCIAFVEYHEPAAKR